MLLEAKAPSRVQRESLSSLKKRSAVRHRRANTIRPVSKPIERHPCERLPSPPGRCRTKARASSSNRRSLCLNPLRRDVAGSPRQSSRVQIAQDHLASANGNNPLPAFEGLGCRSPTDGWPQEYLTAGKARRSGKELLKSARTLQAVNASPFSFAHRPGFFARVPSDSAFHARKFCPGSGPLPG